jgi:hypothetical protein
MRFLLAVAVAATAASSTAEARQKAVAEIVDRADQRPAKVIPIIRQIQPHPIVRSRE